MEMPRESLQNERLKTWKRKFATWKSEEHASMQAKPQMGEEGKEGRELLLE